MPNLRERRKQRTSDTIRAVTVDLVGEFGLDQVTTEMISEKAGISARTFFNYFPYKEAALTPPEQSFSPETVQKFVEGSGDFLKDFEALIIPFTEPYCKDPTLLRKLFAISESHPRLATLKANSFHDFEQKLAAVLAQRPAFAQSSTDLTAALLSAAMRVALIRWVNDGTGELTDFIRQALKELPTAFVDRA